MNGNENIANMTCNAFPDIPMIDPKIEIFDIEKLIPNNDFYMSAKEYFADNIIVDLISSTNLEKRTVLQGECSEWVLECQSRITASNFGRILYQRVNENESQ